SMLEPFYHVGFVVDDLELAQREMTAALGLTWGNAMTIPVPVHHDGEVTLREFTFVYSLTGPPHVELVRAGDPPWTATEGVHHLGYWSDDLAADIERLQANGHTLVANAVDETGALFGFAYLRSAHGLLIELVDVAVRPMLAAGL